MFEAYYFYGRNYWAQGDLEKAASMFAKAAAICPEDHQSRVLLANVYRGLGRDDDAKASMRDALALIERTVEAKPDDIRAIYHGAGRWSPWARRSARWSGRSAVWPSTPTRSTTWPAPTPWPEEPMRQFTTWAGRSTAGSRIDSGSRMIRT